MARDLQQPTSLPDLLIGQRVELRPFKAADANAYLDAVEESRQELQRWFAWAGRCDSIRAAELFIINSRILWLQQTSLRWSVWSNVDHRLLGMVELHQIDWELGNFELGYWLRRSAQSCGFAREACTVLIEFAFHTLGANRFEVRTEPANSRSLWLAERLGFQSEGTLRRVARSGNGDPVDKCVLSLLRDEYHNSAPGGR